MGFIRSRLKQQQFPGTRHVWRFWQDTKRVMTDLTDWRREKNKSQNSKKKGCKLKLFNIRINIVDGNWWKIGQKTKTKQNVTDPEMES